VIWNVCIHRKFTCTCSTALAIVHRKLLRYRKYASNHYASNHDAMCSLVSGISELLHLCVNTQFFIASHAAGSAHCKFSGPHCLTTGKIEVSKCHRSCLFLLQSYSSSKPSSLSSKDERLFRAPAIFLLPRITCKKVLSQMERKQKTNRDSRDFTSSSVTK